jgi:AmmeMemoRadiSam system protein A
MRTDTPDSRGGTDRSRVAASDLTTEDRALLARIAWDSIRSGLDTGQPADPDPSSVPEVFTRPGAVFVTLECRGELRGCVGSFEPRRPLYRDVAQNAFSAAFMDFRFSPLSRAELPDLDLHLSLLGPLEPMEVETREELLEALRPGVDGLLLEDPPHRAIFLPQVWHALPDPRDFLGELLRKAGLGRDHWSGTLRFHRYQVEEL